MKLLVFLLYQSFEDFEISWFLLEIGFDEFFPGADSWKTLVDAGLQGGAVVSGILNGVLLGLAMTRQEVASSHLSSI